MFLTREAIEVDWGPQFSDQTTNSDTSILVGNHLHVFLVKSGLLNAYEGFLTWTWVLLGKSGIWCRIIPDG